MQRWWKIMRHAAAAWYADNAFAHSAAVSFYTVFSLAPITLIVVAVVSVFFGHHAAEQQFVAQVGQLVGRSSAVLIQKAMTANAVQANRGISTVIGTVLLVVGATTVFAQLQQSLNELWHVTTKPTTNTWLDLLLWIYYSCAIVFFGVEFVRAHRLDRGLPIVPKATAVRVRRELDRDPDEPR